MFSLAQNDHLILNNNQINSEYKNQLPSRTYFPKVLVQLQHEQEISADDTKLPPTTEQKSDNNWNYMLLRPSIQGRGKAAGYNYQQVLTDNYTKLCKQLISSRI
jgi:hypothetical protein